MSVGWSDYGKYTTDIFTTEAVETIRGHNATKQPLFLYLAHLAVHSANTYSPLQAPEDVIDQFKYIKDPNRRIFAAMLYKLDDSVGQVVKALKAQNMLQDSVIMFSTDNGGPAAGFDVNYASNWPLKGVSSVGHIALVQSFCKGGEMQ
jgi:arylsulfatase B